MLSNFQVTVRVWLPERLTAGFAPSVNTRLLVEQAEAFGSHVATMLKAALLSVPDDPAAAVQVAAFQVTSVADQVVPPGDGGVNDAPLAFTDTRSCLVAEASTIWSMLIEAPLATVLEATSVTLNVIPAGTTILACSLTMTETVVV
jgi:hypothetical protein